MCVGEREREQERERENIHTYIHTHVCVYYINWETKILDKQAHTRPTQFTRLLDFPSSYYFGLSERH
jgi:hypothetical protein